MDFNSITSYAGFVLFNVKKGNKWFNNVELVIAEQIGTQTTTYVRNIYKYYVAYKLTLDAKAEAEKARLQVVPNPR
jgi:hypothetical protein